MSDITPPNPAAIVGAPTIARLRKEGMAVVPFNVPDYAVGEVMTWTGCSSPNAAWEAINCALNLLANRRDDDNPAYIETMARLGSGELSLTDWRAQQRAARDASDLTLEDIRPPAEPAAPPCPSFWLGVAGEGEADSEAAETGDGDAQEPEAEAPRLTPAEDMEMIRRAQIRRDELQEQVSQSPVIGGILRRYEHLARRPPRDPKVPTGMVRPAADGKTVSYFCVLGTRGDKLQRPGDQVRATTFWVGDAAEVEDGQDSTQSLAERLYPEMAGWLRDGPVGRELL